MRFLFTTLQFAESEFYGRVGRDLAREGHEVSHITISRRAAEDLRAGGSQAWCLPDVMAGLLPADTAGEVRRIEATYDTPSLRDVYVTDPACAGRDEGWCVERTVAHFRALEQIFDVVRPHILVPEVGSETIRAAAHLVARQRGLDVLYLFFTIFPRPLRLYVNTYHAPIVAPEEVRPLDPDERREVEDFIASFTARATPILAHRRARITLAKLREFARHVLVRLTDERDNDYLRPSRFVRNVVSQRARTTATRRLYEAVDADRPFIFFPLHVTDDFKVKRVIPHCVDQAAIIEQIARALPHGYDLVLKEHPVSLGRNPVSMLRRLTRHANVRLVEPYTSSHALIRDAAAVVVISSTVGLEALLYGRPVLTLGQPFYSGYGITLDVDSFRELRRAVPSLLRFAPDRERTLQFLHAAMRAGREGAPAGVDASDENARALARSLHDVAVARAPTGAAA